LTSFYNILLNRKYFLEKNNMKKIKLFIIFVIIFLSSSLSAVDGGWWKLYFSTPRQGTSHSAYNSPESALVRTIDGAESEFYGAFYDITSSPVVNALVRAKKNGVDVKLVTEKKNYSRPEVTRLISHGIEVVPDSGSGLMHNKFAVIDGKILWTGSYNVTKNGSAKNNNNAIKIYSGQLADIYLNEFIEMFNDRIFGNKKEYGPFNKIMRKYYVKISDTNVNVYFSPEDNVERIILKRIKKAKKSIHFMAFSFTSDSIGEAMISKFRQGIDVYGIFEKRGANTKYSEYRKMQVEGLPVKIDKNRYAMHHKVIIIDGERVIMGSYNFSKNASKRNDENVLMIDNREIAAEYIKEFDRLYR